MLDVNQYLKRIQEGNIIDRAKAFARWMDGHCKFCPEEKGQNDDPVQKHHFGDAIQKNEVIVNIAFDIRSFEDKVGKKVESFKDMW